MRQELDQIQGIQMDESIHWIKEVLIELFEGQLRWEADIEKVIEESGINVKISNDRRFHLSDCCLHN